MAFHRLPLRRLPEAVPGVKTIKHDATMNVRQCLFLASAVLLVVVPMCVCCKREPEPITSLVLADIKAKTGVGLPASCRLIDHRSVGRMNNDRWLIELDTTNKPTFPVELMSIDLDVGYGTAKRIKAASRIDIGTPIAAFISRWSTSSNHCQAIWVTTTNGDFLDVSRFY